MTKDLFSRNVGGGEGECGCQYDKRDDEDADMNLLGIQRNIGGGSHFSTFPMWIRMF